MLETTPVESNVQNTRNSIKLAQSRTNQDTVQAGDTRSTGSKQANVFGSLSYRNNPSQEVMINSEINNDMEAQQLNFDDYTNKTSNLELDSLKVIENQQRKVKKRLQLKNLIITKFRNKYDASASNEDDVNNVIQEEVDNLFSQDQFDERDLVTVDRKIRTFIQHKKDKQLQKESKQLPDDAKTEISNSKRATIATARLLDGGCKEDLTGTRSKIGTLADLQTRATVSRLPKNSTVMPLTLDNKLQILLSRSSNMLVTMPN